MTGVAEPGDGGAERARWRAACAVSLATVIALRLLTSRGRREFAIWPDEPAQLAMARFGGGGTRWNMYNHSTWRPGYATLLAPVHWFTDDPILVFRSALALNALLGGIAAALLVLVAQRLTSMGPWTSAAVVALVALSPAVLFHTDFVWSESLVVPLFVGFLLMLLRLVEAPTLRRGLATGLLAGAAFATHSRMVPLSLITIGVVVLAARRRRLPTAHAIVVIAWTAAAMVAVSAYSRWIVGHLWNEPSNRNSFGGALDQLTRPGAILISLAGQSWYLLVSTLGLVAYGTIALVWAAIAPNQSTPRSLPAGSTTIRSAPGGEDARVVLVTVGACMALSVAFMADRWRPDQLVYGRYNDAVVGPVVIVGIATLLGSPSIRRVVLTLVGAVATTIALAGVLWVARRELLAESNGLEPMILGLQPFVHSASSVPLWPITLTAAALMVLLVVAATAVCVTVRETWASKNQTQTALTLGVLVGLVVVGTMRTRTIIDRDWFDRGDGSAVAELRSGALDDVADVDFLLPAGSTATGTMMLYQMYLLDTAFTVVSDPSAANTTAFVFAPIDEAELDESGAKIVWSDPRRNVALWQR